MKQKMKSKRAAAKRFKFTASGKVKFKRGYLRHNLGHRSRDVKVKLRHPGYLENRGDQKTVKHSLPYGNVR